MRRALAGNALAATVFALALGFARPAAALPKILICYADPNAAVAQTIATGINPNNQYFAQVDTADCSKMTPSLMQLKGYDGVLAWDDLQYADRAGLGDNLADYVDAGGGVVQGMFNFYSSFGQGWDLQGRWASGSYNCITPGDQKQVTLSAKPNDPNSPLVQGVATFTSQNAGTGGLAKGATSVWDYTGGLPAIATCTPNNHLRVDLNFYPNPSNWTGDGYALMRNALIAVAGGLSPLKATPSPISFPDTGTGATSAAATITFTNAGMAPETATGVSITGAAATEFGLVQQPTFPVTLAPGQSFTVAVDFSPLTTGARTAQFSVALAPVNGMAVPSAAVTLQGNGIGAKLTITPNPIAVGGTQIGQPITSTATVTNGGGGRITIASITVGGPAFSIVSGPDLPIVLSGGGTFGVTIGFSPTANGLASDTLKIVTNDPNAPTLSVPVTGFAGPPAIGTDAGTVAFGAINVGARSPQQTINVQNVGFSDLTLTDAIHLAGANAADFVLDTKGLGKGSVIPAQSAMPIGVSFAPSAVGNRVGQIVIASSDALTPTKTVGLFGTGTTTSLGVSPTMLAFGTVRVGATSMGQPVQITSTGAGTLHVMAIALMGANAGDFVQSAGPQAPFTVAGNASQSISFACRPSGIGASSATANVVTDVGSAMVALTCSAVAPRITVTPNEVDFGVVGVGGTSAPTTVTIANNGTDDLDINGITIAGADASDFTLTDLPQNFPVTVKAGQSTSFTVTFSPSNATQEKAEIDFDTDDPLLPSGHIALTGAGAMAGLTVSPQTVDFGQVQAGASSAPMSVTLTNTGAVPLAITQALVTGPQAGVFETDRTVDKTNPITLAPKQAFTLHVTFSPLAAGSFLANLQVGADALSQPIVVVLRGAGWAPVVRIGVPGGATTLDFGDVAVGSTSTPTQIVVKNFGSTQVTLGALASDNAAFKVDASQAQTTLAPSAQTSVFITFAPTSTGSAKATFTVKLKNETSAVASLPLAGNGTAASSGGCAVSQAAGRGEGGVPSVALIAVGCALALVARRRRDRDERP